MRIINIKEYFFTLESASNELVTRLVTRLAARLAARLVGKIKKTHKRKKR